MSAHLWTAFGTLVDLLGSIDILGYLFLAGSLVLLWGLGVALADHGDPRESAPPGP